MSETTEFKDVYEAIASVSPNRQNILYTVLEEDAFGEKAFFSDDKLVWESTKGGFFSQNQEEVGKLHDSGQATAAGKKLFCDCLGGEKRLVICGGGHVSMPVIQLGAMMELIIVNLSAEAKKPTRDIPMVMIISTLCVAVIYGIVAVVAAGVLPVEQVAGENLSIDLLHAFFL